MLHCKSQQRASTHAALVESERCQALLANEVSQQRSTHTKLTKEIKRLKAQVQKTENLLHDVLEAVWQKEFTTEDAHAGL